MLADGEEKPEAGAPFRVSEIRRGGTVNQAVWP